MCGVCPRNIKCAGVSAATGKGIPALFTKFDEAAVEFSLTVAPEQTKRAMDRLAETEQRKAADLVRLQADLGAEKAKGTHKVPPPTANVVAASTRDYDDEDEDST